MMCQVPERRPPTPFPNALTEGAAHFVERVAGLLLVADAPARLGVEGARLGPVGCMGWGVGGWVGLEGAAACVQRG